MRVFLKWLGLGLGTGLSPKAPGTVGSLAAVLLAGFFGIFHNPWVILLSIVLGIIICEVAERELGKKDDGRIVFDEFVGQWIAVFGFSGYYLIGGFILFRIFDILKPPPIRGLQKFHGGLGIMLDDIIAGVFAWVVLTLCKTWLFQAL